MEQDTGALTYSKAKIQLVDVLLTWGSIFSEILVIMFCSHFAEAIQASTIRSSNYGLIVNSLAAENLPV